MNVETAVLAAGMVGVAAANFIGTRRVRAGQAVKVLTEENDALERQAKRLATELADVQAKNAALERTNRLLTSLVRNSPEVSKLTDVVTELVSEVKDVKGIATAIRTNGGKT